MPLPYKKERAPGIGVAKILAPSLPDYIFPLPPAWLLNDFEMYFCMKDCIFVSVFDVRLGIPHHIYVMRYKKIPMKKSKNKNRK